MRRSGFRLIGPGVTKIMVVYCNGKWSSRDEAVVPADDRGLLYGYGLFETLAVRGGRPRFVSLHLGRLFDSAPLLGINLPWEKGEIAALLEDTAARNDTAEGALRLTVTAGVGPAFEAGGGSGPLLLITAHPGSAYPGRVHESGLKGRLSGIRRNHRSPLCRVKSLNYLDSLLARRDAVAAGADEAILLNCDGDLAEGAATNLFFVKGDRLCTPALESGALPGVMRRIVLGLVRGSGGGDALPAGLEVEEGVFRLADLLAADEAFLTNSLLGVAPLVLMNGRAVGGGKPGSVTGALQGLQLTVEEETINGKGF